MEKVDVDAFDASYAADRLTENDQLLERHANVVDIAAEVHEAVLRSVPQAKGGPRRREPRAPPRRCMRL